MASPVSEHTGTDDELESESGVNDERFPHPFTQGADYEYYDFDEDDPTEQDTPRTLVELRMCALSASIREKADWHIKFRDEKIRSKWIEEIHEQQKDVHQSLQLTDNMVRGQSILALCLISCRMWQINYVLTELQAYAALRDESTGIEVRFCTPMSPLLLTICTLISLALTSACGGQISSYLPISSQNYDPLSPRSSPSLTRRKTGIRDRTARSWTSSIHLSILLYMDLP